MTDSATHEDQDAVLDRLSWNGNDIVFEQRVDPRQELPVLLTRAAMSKQSSNAVEIALKNGSKVLRPFQSKDSVRFTP